MIRAVEEMAPAMAPARIQLRGTQIVLKLDRNV